MFKEVSENGNNCFLNSCTGSGKTLAYLLPVLNKVMNGVIDKDKEKLGKGKDTRVEGEGKRKAQHGAVILTLNK